MNTGTLPDGRVSADPRSSFKRRRAAKKNRKATHYITNLSTAKENPEAGSTKRAADNPWSTARHQSG